MTLLGFEQGSCLCKSNTLRIHIMIKASYFDDLQNPLPSPPKENLKIDWAAIACLVSQDSKRERALRYD